eukprot:tig00021293_g20019.t1
MWPVEEFTRPPGEGEYVFTEAARAAEARAREGGGPLYVLPLQTTADYSYVADFWRELLLNAAAGLRRAGLGGEYVVVATEAGQAEWLAGRGQPVVLDGRWAGRPLSYLDALFMKFRYAADFLERVGAVAVVDADVVVLEDPRRRGHFGPGAHLEMMSEAFDAAAVPRAQLNTGFFAAREDAAGAAAAFARAVLRARNGSELDQDAFNRLLEAAPHRLELAGHPVRSVPGPGALVVRVLPLLEYPNGLQHFWMGGPGRAGVAPAAVHANWAHRDAKRFILEHAGLWFLPPREGLAGRGRLSVEPLEGSPSFAEEVAALKDALLLARATGRALVAPTLPCRHLPFAAAWELPERCGLHHFLDPRFVLDGYGDLLVHAGPGEPPPGADVTVEVYPGTELGALAEDWAAPLSVFPTVRVRWGAGPGGAPPGMRLFHGNGTEQWQALRLLHVSVRCCPPSVFAVRDLGLAWPWDASCEPADPARPPPEALRCL